VKGLENIELELYIRAGKIACIVRKDAEKYVRPGLKLIDVANFIEQKIVELGGQPAFPVNISIDSIAAHYTPVPNDNTTINYGSIIKIDIGVHIDGYIADTATTISLSDMHRPLVEATQQALEKALAAISIGKRFSDIGAIIEKTIKSYGFKPIYNLSGHRIDRYVIHAGETIPNFNDRLNLGKFRPGNTYAIEPFATNGAGFVEDEKSVTIYALVYNPKKISKLSNESHKFYSYIYSLRRTLPFAIRWYTNIFSETLIEKILQELTFKGLLTKYPVLVEKNHGIVTQFEHTLVIDKQGNIIVTTDHC